MEELIINIGIPALLIILAMFTGTIIEKRHYKSIREREAVLNRLPAIPIGKFEFDRPVAEVRFVTGSVVVSVDYFKTFLGKLRNIFGGEMTSFDSILDRGRREAMLRMKEQFPEADIILNFRMETSALNGEMTNRNANALLTVEVFTYGTAVKFA